jgi:hypothetical protein
VFGVDGTVSVDTMTIQTDDAAFATTELQIAAALAPTDTTGASILSVDQLAPIFEEAKLLWAQALGAGDVRLAAMAGVNVRVDDLASDVLGATIGTTITIDADAAGWGWFVDQTPWESSEFQILLSVAEFATDPASPAFGRMDLLSTVLHELGHTMGFTESQGDDVMNSVLPAGVRRLPEAVPVPTAEAGVISNIPLVAAVAPGLTATLSDRAPVTSLPRTSAVATLERASFLDAVADKLPGAASAPQVPEPDAASDGEFGTQFVELDPSLAWPGVQIGPSESASSTSGAVADQAPAETPRSTRASADTTPSLKWESDQGKGPDLGGFAESSSEKSPGWLENFLHNLGQAATQRDPNAGIRLRP